MKKALQVASVASMIDQFNRENINILKKLGYEVHVAANFEFGSTCSQERVNQCKTDLLKRDIRVYNLLFDRKIFNKSNIEVYKQLKKIINENHYEIIHCHSPVGGVITRLAARKARRKGTRVIYTAHGFHFFKGSPLLNWLIYFPVELICSFFTDVLITINQEDYNLAKKYMKAKQIKYIPGVGVDTEKIKNIVVDKKKKRKELGIPEDAIIYFSAGELAERKNHEVIIRALGKLDSKKLYYIICGEGKLKTYLKDLSQELGILERVIFLGFRTDVIELCKCSDVYIFPSIREGLGIAALEGMASGLPLICSDINGIKDYAENNKTGFAIAPKDIDGFARAMKTLSEDSELRVKMEKYNLEVVKKFDINNTNSIMKNVYTEVL